MSFDISSLELEPMITKHRPHYDDPWGRFDEIYLIRHSNFTSNRKRKPVICLDIITCIEVKYPSVRETARQIGSTPGNVSVAIVDGHTLLKRYKVREE